MGALKPAVSIVMPNYNSPVVDKTIARLLQQSFKGEFEIIIVGKDDLKLIKPNKKIKSINTAQKTIPSKARNMGLRKARAETIVFIDSDCVPERKWLQALMENPRDIVSGAIEFNADNFWTTCDNFIHFHGSNRKLPGGEIGLIGTIQLKIPKKKILAVGSFDESLETGEDLDIAIKLKKAGEIFYFEPRAVARHYPNRKSPGSILTHSMYWARNGIKVRLRHKEFLRIPGWVQNRWLLLIASPAAALAVSLKIYAKKCNRGYLYLFPLVWLAKLFWFFGAFQGLKNA